MRGLTTTDVGVSLGFEEGREGTHTRVSGWKRELEVNFFMSNWKVGRTQVLALLHPATGIQVLPSIEDPVDGNSFHPPPTSWVEGWQR